MKDLEPVWTHVSYKLARSAKTSRYFRQYFGFAKLRDTATQQKAIEEFSGKSFDKRVVKIAAVSDKPKESKSDEVKEVEEETEEVEEAAQETPKETELPKEITV